MSGRWGAVLYVAIVVGLVVFGMLAARACGFR